MPMDMSDRRAVDAAVGRVEYAVRNGLDDVAARVTTVGAGTEQIVPWLTAVHAQLVETNRLLGLLLAK